MLSKSMRPSGRAARSSSRTARDRTAAVLVEDPDGRDVVGALLQGFQERARDAVAGHHDGVTAVPLDGVPDRIGVEVPGLLGQHDGAAAVEGVEHAPLAGAVHEGEADERPAADAHADVGRELLVGLEAREARDVPSEPVEEDVLVPPQDALRHARRAAGVEQVDVVGRVGQVGHDVAGRGYPCSRSRSRPAGAAPPSRRPPG